MDWSLQRYVETVTAVFNGGFGRGRARCEYDRLNLCIDSVRKQAGFDYNQAIVPEARTAHPEAMGFYTSERAVDPLRTLMLVDLLTHLLPEEEQQPLLESRATRERQIAAGVG